MSVHDVVVGNALLSRSSQVSAEKATRVEQAALHWHRTLQPLVVEADAGQKRLEQHLVVHLLPMVKDITDMVGLVERSVATFESTSAANRQLREERGMPKQQTETFVGR